MRALLQTLLYRQPLRSRLFREVGRRFGLFPYESRIQFSAIDRPAYGYCVLRAADLAKRLGYKEISIIEFGVAGGNGLVNLEMHVQEVKKLIDVDIQIFGFDTGAGLPPPTDYRDLPQQWKQGFFKMDIDRLKSRLKYSKLVIGDVAETISSFIEVHNPAPIGAVFLDLDYYSSTKHALTLFDIDRRKILPRVFVYLDDVIGDAITLYSEYTGVRLAIAEFNKAHEEQKICETTFLGIGPFQESWHHNIFVYHDYHHPQYCTFIADPLQQLPLQL